MRRLALAVGLVLCTGLAPAWSSSPPRPSHKALRTAFEWAAPSVVVVKGPKKSGLGVVVGESGQIVTSVEFVALDAATVVMGGRELPARVLAADAQLKFAVVQVESEAATRAAAAHLPEDFARGRWLVAVSLNPKGKTKPSHGQVMRGPTPHTPFVETDFTLPPGSPLFDPRGRLVAMVVEKRARGSRALPLQVVKERLAQAASQEPTR